MEGLGEGDPKGDQRRWRDERWDTAPSVLQAGMQATVLLWARQMMSHKVFQQVLAAIRTLGRPQEQRADALDTAFEPN